MMRAVEELVRKNIRSLKPYRSARQEFSGKADVLLDANENAFSQGYNRYPDPMQIQLKTALSHLKQFPVDQIFLGNGSDEGIDLLIRIFCRPGYDNIIVMPPTFSWFTVCANVADVEVKEALLGPSFAFDVDAIRQQTDEHSKIIFLCNPNNPTGTEFDDAKIEAVLEEFPGIVVIDEAYKDFSTRESWIHRITEYPHLVVTQTFSKAWGKAGLRVGMVYAQPKIIHYLNAVKAPYNVNAASQASALKALENVEEVTNQVQIVREERARVAKELRGSTMVKEVFPSEANFLLVQFDDSQIVYDALSAGGVVVRDRSREPGCQNCLRITIGTPSENDRLLHILKSMP